MTIRRQLIAALGLALLFLTAVSCVREFEESTRLPEQGTRVTLTIFDEPWVSTRSAYTPGEGVHLTKTEQIGLFYDNGSLLVGNGSYAIKATPQGGGVYSFTAPEGSLDKTWYAIVPYSHNQARARLNTAKQFHIVFPCTQFPGQNTFDPATDFLVGKPFTIDAEGAGTATIDAFKRLTAPFKLEITGLDPGEKIYAVTFAQSTKASGYNASTGVLNVLAGKCLFKVGAEPDDFAFDSVNPSLTRSNDVSAIYDEGLVGEGGVWPVWLNVLPGTIARNTQITVTVFTAKTCYTRKVSIGSEAKTFATDKINKLTFDIKGPGYTSEPAISQGFFHNGMDAATSGKTVRLTATDGVERDWEIRGFNWTAAAQDGGSVLPSVLGFPKGVDACLKIPVVEGNQVTKVRLYLAPVSHLENYAFPLEVYHGETLLATVANITMLDLSQGYTPGGIVDIPCPEGVSDMAGLTLKFGACTRNANALVSRMVLFTKEVVPPAPPVIEGTDHYRDFVDGKDLVIGGLTVNQSTHPRYALVRLSQLASGSDLAGYLGGDYDIVFLDYVLPADAGADRLVISDANLSPSGGVALVGRYATHHSELVFQGKSITPKGSLALKNVCVRTNTNALTTAAMTVSDSRLDIADCAFYLTPNEGAAGSLVYDSKSTSPLGSFTLKNSVVVRRNDYNHALFRSSAYGAIPYKDFMVENNALVYASDILGKDICTSNLFTLSTDSEAKNPTLEFTFRNNSVLGYKGNGTVLATCDPKAIVCEDNVLEEKLTLAVYLFNVYYPYSKLSAQTSSVGGNYCNNSGAFVSGVDFVNGDTLKARFAVPSPNRFEYGLAPYSLVDTNSGYLGLIPALAGKGCSYETKLWRDWAADAGGNTESYGEGHGSDEFGWQ